MFRKLKTIVLAAVVATLAPLAAAAQGAPDFDEIARVEILHGWRLENGNHMAALRISLEDGWKTYWRTPGDSGIPPSFSLEGSRNLRSVEFHWPTPKVFDLGGLTTFGYDGDVVIPIELTPARPGGGDIVIRGTAELGVCRDVCVPLSVGLNTRLSGHGQDNQKIRASLNDQPMSGEAAGIPAVRCEVDAISDGLRVNARIALPAGSGPEHVIVELPDQAIWISSAVTSRKGSELLASADMVPPAAAPFALNRSDLRFTVLSGKNAYDIRGCIGG